MRKKAFFQAFLLVVVGCLFFSCSNTPDNEVEYFAFQETKDGDWGLIAPDGEVLFAGEFDNAPTVVRDGRFFVRNDKGYWELFEADKKPKKIGSEYLSVSAFRNGHAFVVEKDKPVTIINTKGETVKELHKIEGKKVVGVYAPNKYGYAQFRTEDELYGVINLDGECVIKPEYIELRSTGRNSFIAVSKKYKDKDSKKYSILNQKGEVLFELSSDRYKDFGYTYDGKLFPVAVEKNNEKAWGLLNDKGEEVLKPTTRIDDIKAVFGEKFIFCKDHKWGLMNVEGEKLIYAKYDNLFFEGNENVLKACKVDNGMSWKYINEEDEQLSPETYKSVESFSDLDGEHALIKPDDNTYALINRDYEMIKGLPDMVDVSLDGGSSFVESDYVDLNELIAQLQLKQNSFFGLSLQSKPVDAVTLSHQWDETKEEDPYWYVSTSQLAMRKSLDYTHLDLEVIFDNVISGEEEVSEEVYANGGSGPCEWTDAKPQKIELEIANSIKLQGKMKTLFGMIAEIYKKGAAIVKQNNNALLLKCKDGSVCAVVRENRGITISIISATYAADFLEGFSIDQYKEDIKEVETNPHFVLDKISSRYGL